MGLPELPKIHKKKEADFGITFRKWVEGNSGETSAFELKQTDGKEYLSFSEVKQKQIDYGMRIKKSNEGVLIRTKGIEGLPDYIFIKKEPSWIVIKYPSFFAVIDVEKFQKERDRDKKIRSLTADRAKTIAYYYE